MKVILTRDVPKVGKDGEIVVVADGYARNYLFPRQLALVAKGAAMKQHENRISREVERTSRLLTEAQANSEKITGRSFQVIAKASPKSTRLFGSVTEADAAAIIQKETGIEVDKRKISLIDPIKVTGVYELTVRLHPEVTASFTLEVATAEQLEMREKTRVAAEEKAAKETAAAAAAAQAAEERAVRLAEERAARAAANEGEEQERPVERPRRQRSFTFEAPDAEG